MVAYIAESAYKNVFLRVSLASRHDPTYTYFGELNASNMLSGAGSPSQSPLGYKCQRMTIMRFFAFSVFFLFLWEHLQDRNAFPAMLHLAPASDRG